MAEVSAKHTWTVSTDSDETLGTQPILLVRAELGAEGTRHGSNSSDSLSPSRHGQASAEPNRRSQPGPLQEVAVTGQCQGPNLCHVSDHKAYAFNCQNVMSNEPLMLALAASEQSEESAKGPTLHCL